MMGKPFTVEIRRDPPKVRREPRPGQRKCPRCGRFSDWLWRLEGDDQAMCANCIRYRREERQAEQAQVKPA